MIYTIAQRKKKKKSRRETKIPIHNTGKRYRGGQKEKTFSPKLDSCPPFFVLPTTSLII